MMMQYGLGAYPNDFFYDSNRPSWLPYWIDTPTESKRKYEAVYRLGVGFPDPPSAKLPAPQTKEEMTVGGAWTPEIAFGQMWENYKRDSQEFMNRVDGETKAGGWSWVEWGMVGVGVLVAAKLLRR